MPDDPAEIDWSPDTTVAWRDTVNAWRWSHVGPDAWSKHGMCPRCHHAMSVTVIRANVVAFDMDLATRVALATGAALDDGKHSPDERLAYCNCGEKHPGRPGDIPVGCGNRAYVTPPSDSSSDD